MTISWKDACPEDILRSEQESEPILCVHCGKEIENWYEDDGIFTRLGDTAHKVCDDRYEDQLNYKR